MARVRKNRHASSDSATIGGTGAPSRFDVRSPDGTTIAVWVEGSGPPMVMVHGALTDHTADAALAGELRDAATLFAVDRRGRGASGDAPAYMLQREFEDVAAVVEDVASRAGSPVAVWGHSYGADCAMGAATLTDRIGRLILYEPGLGIPVPTTVIEEIEQRVATGDMEGAMLTALTRVVEMTDEEVAFLRAGPSWPSRLAAVPAMPRELRAESGWVYRPGQFDAVTAPTLILAGSESPPAQSDASRRGAAAIRNARIHTLEGHGHIAHRTDPAMVAAIVRDFAFSYDEPPLRSTSDLRH